MTVKRIALLLLAMLIALGSAAWADTEAFRSGRVIEVVGSASVARSNYQMPAYAQMMIQSGDLLTTEADGQVILCLDEDKYLILEPETKALFELEGTPQRGMIRIRLLAGAVYSEIENPLSDGDAYEIHTTDAVMAVRGTHFRASHEVDEEKRQSRTEIQLFFGEVEVSASGEQPRKETLSGGEEISITTPLDESGNPAGEPEMGQKQPLDMDDLPDGYDRDMLEEREGLFRQGGGDGESAAVCPACQQEIVHEEEHAPAASLSGYCREQHHRCTGMMHYCDPQTDYNADKAGLQGGCGGRHGCESSNAHTLCRMCGDMWCDYDNGGHETPCGNAYHRPCQQPGGTHQLCEYCEEWLCYPGETAHGPGEDQCGGAVFIPIPCFGCGEVGANHNVQLCNTHCEMQEGDHTYCAYCGDYKCSAAGAAEHGDGLCNLP